MEVKMIKGCKKNVVYVRNTDSKLFEEAYFILSDDFEQSPTSEPDMLAEANRIIARTPVASYFGMTPELQRKKKSDARQNFSRGLWFIAGALFSSAIALIICFL
jgi:hypothetical protein